MLNYNKIHFFGLKNKDLKENKVIFETLVDKLFKSLNSAGDSEDGIINNITIFCQNNNIQIHTEKANHTDSFVTDDEQIVIRYTDNTSDKQILLILLHELSHIISNRATEGRLFLFQKHINSVGFIDLNNLQEIKTELNYFLSPRESANMALTFALNTFNQNYTLSQIYKDIRQDLKIFDDPNQSRYYKELNQDLKLFYNIVYYVLRIKSFNVEERTYNKYMTKLQRLISTADKYSRRLHIYLKF